MKHLTDEALKRCPRGIHDQGRCTCSSTKNEHGEFPVEKTELACLRSIDAKLGTIKSIAIFWCVTVPILCVVIGMIVSGWTASH